MTLRNKDINTINLIVLRAEQDIFRQTGEDLRLIIAPAVALNPKLDAASLVRVVCNALGETEAACHHRSREPRYVHLRALCVYFVRQYYPDMTLKNVANTVMGHDDHTQVIYYTNWMEKELDSNDDPEFKKKYDAALQAATQWAALEEEEL